MATPRATFFIAHAGADAHHARTLRALLHRHPRVSTFLDATDLIAGQKWNEELPRAQAAARATVLLLSDTRPHYLEAEIARAVAYQHADRDRIRLIPVYLNGCPADVRERPYGLESVVSLDAKVLGLDGVAAELRRIAAADLVSHRVVPRVQRTQPRLGPRRWRRSAAIAAGLAAASGVALLMLRGAWPPDARLGQDAPADRPPAGSAETPPSFTTRVRPRGAVTGGPPAAETLSQEERAPSAPPDPTPVVQAARVTHAPTDLPSPPGRSCLPQWLAPRRPAECAAAQAVLSVTFQSLDGEAFATLRITPAGGAPVARAIVGSDSVPFTSSGEHLQVQVIEIDWAGQRVLAQVGSHKPAGASARERR